MKFSNLCCILGFLVSGAQLQHLTSETDPSMIIVQTSINLNKTTFSNGETITIPCIVTGYPKPTVTWYKDNREIIPNAKIAVKEENVLKIQNANANDTGVYKCRAKNSFTQFSSSVQITVAVPVQTNIPMTDFKSLNGSDVFIPCSVYGYPEPEVTWSKNGVIIKYDSRITIDGYNQLVIHNASSSDTGMYTCNAMNSYSDSSTSVGLAVGGFAPKIDQNVKSEMELEVGSHVTLECLVSGSPKPKVSWKKGSTLIKTHDDHYGITDGGLKIFNLKKRDAGLYTCTAENIVHENATKQFKLIVKDCSRILQSAYGDISYYSPNTNGSAARCEYLIEAGRDERIMLNVSEWRVNRITETNHSRLKVSQNLTLLDDCTVNYLEVRDGSQRNSKLLARLCPTNQTHAVILSSGTEMLITQTMSEEETLRAHRFSANYKAVCGSDVRLDKGQLYHLKSLNYPHYYQPNKECLWRLTAPENYHVALTFDSFEVEEQDNCTYDHVEIYDGHDANSSLIGIYCGYKLPPKILSSGSKLMVKFIPDGSIQNSGFSASVKSEGTG